MSELEACPFCQEHGTFIMDDNFKWYVECAGCEACTKSFDTIEDAISAWNKRAPADKENG